MAPANMRITRMFMSRWRGSLGISQTVNDEPVAVSSSSAREAFTTPSRVGMTDVTFKHVLLPVWISAYLYAGQTYRFLVNARTTLPDSVQSGDTIPATAAELDLILPATLVSRIRDVMEVTKVGGAATSTVLLQGVAPGGKLVDTLEPQVRGLSSPMVAVPASGQLLIPAKGTVDEITVPDFPEGSSGRIYVQMPKVFTLDAKLDLLARFNRPVGSHGHRTVAHVLVGHLGSHHAILSTIACMNTRRAALSLWYADTLTTAPAGR